MKIIFNLLVITPTRAKKAVRLDIAVPKGYDTKVLDGVKKYVKSKNVDVKVFEVE